MSMLHRLPATILAGALVLVPPVGAGLDQGHLGLAPSVLASSSASWGAPAPIAGDSFARALANSRSGSATAGAEGEDGGGGSHDAAGLRAGGPAGAPGSPAVAAFGFGPLTPFLPSAEPRELVLSFDDGPDLKFTPLVLDELDRRGLKAIFFVTGHRVVGDRPEDQARRELLGRIAAHGHMVANHTMTHRNLCQAGEEAAQEIDGNAELIAEATGVRPLLFRAPYGARCHALEAALQARQLVSVGWNLDPQDWRNPSSDEILAYLEGRLARLQGRGILLLHDTHPASVFALGPLLDWIARENRAAVDAGRPPIVLRDYSVFLPERPTPRTGVTAAIASLVDAVSRGLAPQFGWPARASQAAAGH